jgi:RluA family pseudouridine synthase
MNGSAKRSLSLTGEQLTGNVLKKKVSKSLLFKEFCLKPDQPEYYEQDGLLCVKPYLFHHSSFAKKRWIGMTVAELYTNEFLEHPAEYYKHAIEKGMIKINGNLTTSETKIKESDFLQHSYHKHEPPVLAKEIKIVFEDENLVVVDKPGSFHAHPTGRYFHNTIISRLKYLHRYEFLSSINRLDRLTSGIMILAKNVEAARKLTSQMTERQVEKEYLAKVDGELGKYDGDVIEVNLPVGCVNNKLCIHSVFPSDMEDSQAKESKTIFTRMSFCSKTNTTLVNCKPLTGRTHQIRVHLRHLGNPISNDTLYNNKLWNEELVSFSEPDAKQSYDLAKKIAQKMLKAVSIGAFEDDDSLEAEMDTVMNLRNARLKNFDWKENLCYQCATSNCESPKKES